MHSKTVNFNLLNFKTYKYIDIKAQYNQLQKFKTEQEKKRKNVITFLTNRRRKKIPFNNNTDDLSDKPT